MAKQHGSVSIRHEGGQSLVIIILAMTVIMGIAALAIDVSAWYEHHHQDQVVADSAALAAANCLANPNSGSTTVNHQVLPPCSSSANAQNLAVAYAAANGLAITTSDVVVTTGKVTVTARDSAPPIVSSVLGIGNTTVAASAVATYGDQCQSSSGAENCISLFAGNTACPSSSPTDSNPVGLDFLSNGGGHASVGDAYSNGLFDNANNSQQNPGSNVTGVTCQHDSWDNKNTNFTPAATTIPYPETWTQPTCTATASYWTTSAVTAHQITVPGVYCVNATPASCAQGDNQVAGDIYVDQSALTSAGYEFVGPCVSLSNGSNNALNISGQPFVYGTSNITTPATATALPICAVNDGSNGVSTWLNGNGSMIGGTIYDQCGTFEATGNNAVIGYVEAWNIDVAKNNVTGTGPNTVNGVITDYDQLSG